MTARCSRPMAGRAPAHRRLDAGVCGLRQCRSGCATPSPPLRERHGGRSSPNPAFAATPLRRHLASHIPSSRAGQSPAPSSTDPRRPRPARPPTLPPSIGRRGKWPANQLKFYVEFGADEARASPGIIKLLDEQGQVVVGVGRADRLQELWSPDMKRLTVLFDPGRIKRGLKDNMNSGPPLVLRHHYSLVVDKAWPDATGARRWRRTSRWARSRRCGGVALSIRRSGRCMRRSRRRGR